MPCMNGTRLSASSRMQHAHVRSNSLPTHINGDDGRADLIRGPNQPAIVGRLVEVMQISRFPNLPRWYYVDLRVIPNPRE